MCGACACRGRYLQQLPSSLAASDRHRKDILVRCRGRLQQLPRMYTGRTSRPRRRTRSSCAVVPSRHNQRCAKPHAVRIPWRTRGAACALGAPGALHALAGRCMRSRRMGAACARGTRGAACARFIRTVRLLPHGAVAIVRTAASARCYHNRRGTLRTCAGDNGGSFPSCASTARRGRRAAPPVGRPHTIDPGRGRLAANLIQTSLSSVHTDMFVRGFFFYKQHRHAKNHNMQHVQSTCKNITTSNMYSTVCMLTCKNHVTKNLVFLEELSPPQRVSVWVTEGVPMNNPLCP